MKYFTIAIISLFIFKTANAVINCEDYITNEWPSSRYTVREFVPDEKVIIDNQTGLMWKRCSEGLEGINCTTGIISSISWGDALVVARDRFFGGYGDWRLPNVKELQTLVAKNCYNPSINRDAFVPPPWPQGWYWTSSPALFDFGGTFPAKESSWVVEFGFGKVFFHPRGYINHLRLVRNFGE